MRCYSDNRELSTEVASQDMHGTAKPSRDNMQSTCKAQCMQRNDKHAQQLMHRLRGGTWKTHKAAPVSANGMRAGICVVLFWYALCVVSLSSCQHRQHWRLT